MTGERESWRRRVDGFLPSGNRRALEAALTLDEEVAFAVVAASGGIGTGMGILSVTDRRILYVKQRVLQKPRVFELPLGEVTSVVVDDGPGYGSLTIYSKDGAHRW